MEMELLGIFRILRRWLWLIIVIVGITLGLLFLLSKTATVTYTSRVILQITTPDREDVAVIDEYKSTSDREEIINTLNKFIEISQYSAVKRQTLEQLGIDEDYELEVDTESSVDFVYIDVTANTPEIAQQIANAHALTSIEYFGNLRVQPLNQALVYFDDELAAAAENINDAEQALIDFQIEYGIVSVPDELAIQQSVLQTLELNRAELDFTAAVPDLQATPSTSVLDQLLQDNVADNELSYELIDELIADRRQILRDISLLSPIYNALIEDLDEARTKYNTLAEKYVETELKESFARRAFFIQIIEDASDLRTSEDTLAQMMLFGFIGSLGFAILIVFSVDSLFRKPSQS